MIRPEKAEVLQALRALTAIADVLEPALREAKEIIARADAPAPVVPLRPRHAWPAPSDEPPPRSA